MGNVRVGDPHEKGVARGEGRAGGCQSPNGGCLAQMSAALPIQATIFEHPATRESELTHKRQDLVGHQLTHIWWDFVGTVSGPTIRGTL